VTFLNSCKTTALTSPAILAYDIDYIIGDTTASTFALNTFAVGIEPCPLLYEIRYGNGTAIVQPHHLFSLTTYEAVPATYPTFTVGTHSDNSLASSMRIPIILTVKSKYNTLNSQQVTFNVLLK
jgi:hypothetical protein